MKQILFSVLFILISFSAFSQNDSKTEVRNKSQFLTTQMTTLLSLDDQQQRRITNLNRQRYIKENTIEQKLYGNTRYQKMKLNNFAGEKEQEANTKINEAIQSLEDGYDSVMRSVLSSSQYAIYLANKANLLELVNTEFGG